MMHGMPPPYYRDYYPPPRPEPRAVVGSALDDTHRNPNKVFIGGLKPETTSQLLRQHMQQFGRVVDVAVVTDKMTGSSRGFGFCSYVSEECVDKCMAHPTHMINGSKADVRRAVPSSEMPSKRDAANVVDDTKVFVGGVSPEVTEDQLREFLQSFGPIKEVSLRYDSNNRSRGFGFVYFESVEAAERAVGEHRLFDHRIEVKKATPRNVTSGYKPNAMGRYGRQGEYRPSPDGYCAPGHGDSYGYYPPPYGGASYGFSHASYGHPPYDARYGGGPSREYGGGGGPPYYGGYESGYGGGPRMANGHMNYDGPQRAARYGGGSRIHPY